MNVTAVVSDWAMVSGRLRVEVTFSELNVEAAFEYGPRYGLGEVKRDHRSASNHEWTEEGASVSRDVAIAIGKVAREDDTLAAILTNEYGWRAP